MNAMLMCFTDKTKIHASIVFTSLLTSYREVNMVVYEHELYLFEMTLNYE